MSISSRTPEGLPSQCSLCGARTNIEYSTSGGDAPCPNCGYLLWASAQLSQSIMTQLHERLGTCRESLTAGTEFRDLASDSLDWVEVVMELEEDFEIDIPDEVAQRICTIGDAVRMIMHLRGGS